MINHNFSLNNKGFSNSDESASFLRHRWYSYKEGFSPSLVQHAVSSVDFDIRRDIVFDPFNGSGTVTLHSALSGYNAVGLEVNPFSAFISKSKQISFSKRTLSEFQYYRDALFKNVTKGGASPLIDFSTFSESADKQKWLFNLSVLSAYEGGKGYLRRISNPTIRQIFKLALLNSVMENCNAKKDGKCLRYKKDWNKLEYCKESFVSSLKETLSTYLEDIQNSEIISPAKIVTGDCRKLLDQQEIKFKLCITSPPYLNSFDYTDVYRPELFLGEFINSKEALINLRKKTIRSHASVNASTLSNRSFGVLYDNVLREIKASNETPWQKKIPNMVQGYFEDMELTLKKLKKIAKKDAQLWLIVANSAYNDIEIPVDLILADIGSRAGWNLKEVGVLRNILKRGSKYSPEITYLRESAVIFSSSK